MASARFFILAISTSLLLGCTASDAPKTAPVSGTVTMDGKPLAGASVTFFPTSKGPMATGNTNEKGEFTLMTNHPGDGAPVGTHRVAIGNAEEGRRRSGPNIPDRYGQPGTSGLTAEVKPGQKNVVRFELKP